MRIQVLSLNSHSFSLTPSRRCGQGRREKRVGRSEEREMRILGILSTLTSLHSLLVPVLPRG